MFARFWMHNGMLTFGGRRMSNSLSNVLLVHEFLKLPAPEALRWRLLRERVLAMRELWTREEAEFHGELVDFDPIWSWPKPVQIPLPVLVGGNTENTMKRVIAFGD